MFKINLKKLWPKSLLSSNKAYSTGFTWFFGLITIFGLGLLYIVFNQVFVAHIVPTIKEQVNATYLDIPPATVTEIYSNIDKYMDFFHAMPFILFGVVVIYMIVAAIRKERESEYV